MKSGVYFNEKLKLNVFWNFKRSPNLFSTLSFVFLILDSQVVSMFYWDNKSWTNTNSRQKERKLNI